MRIENLHKVFNKNTVDENILYDNFNMTIDRGDFITIIGSNGAGKSTLLNIIAGSIDADDGSIFIEDRKLSNLPQHKRSKFIGRVFQNPSEGTASNMTILENLSMAFNKNKPFNLTPGINKKNIDMFKTKLSTLELGLEDKLYTKVGLLSGGQRQALCLIMAVLNKPELLLLDEHTAALDPKTSEKIIELTEKVVKENNVTTLMVTHNLSHAIRLGNRLIMMHRGENVLDFSGEEKKRLTVDKLIDKFSDLNGNDYFSDRMLLA